MWYDITKTIKSVNHFTERNVNNTSVNEHIHFNTKNIDSAFPLKLLPSANIKDLT